jgi:hypothetical protein
LQKERRGVCHLVESWLKQGQPCVWVSLIAFEKSLAMPCPELIGLHRETWFHQPTSMGQTPSMAKAR